MVRKEKSISTAVTCFVCFLTTATAQSLLTLGGGGYRPEPLSELESFVPSGENWLYSLELSNEFDSNPGLREDGGSERIFSELIPSLTFNSDPEGAATNRVRVVYRPRFRVDWTDSDLSDVLHETNIYYRNRGAKGELLVYGSLLEIANPDRITGTFIEGQSYNVGSNVSYEVGSRSRLLFETQFARSNFDTAGFSDITTWEVGAGFDWTSPSQLRLGPFLRYTTSESSSGGERDAFGLLLSAELQASKDLELQALIGIDYSRFSAGGNDALNLTGNIRFRRRIGDDWLINAGLGIVTLPSNSNEGIVFTDYQASLVATKELSNDVSLGIGGEIGFTEFDDSESLQEERDDTWVFTISASYRRPILIDFGYVEVRLGYGVSRGEFEWERTTLDLSFGTTF